MNKKIFVLLTAILAAALLCCAALSACEPNNADKPAEPTEQTAQETQTAAAEPTSAPEPAETEAPAETAEPTEEGIQFPIVSDTDYISGHERYVAAANAILAGEAPEDEAFAPSDMYVWFNLEQDGLKAYSQKNVRSSMDASFTSEVTVEYSGLLAVFPYEVGELANRKLCEYANEYIFYNTEEDTCLIDQGLLGDNWFALVSMDDSMQDLQVHCLFYLEGGEWKEFADNNGGLYIDGSDRGASQTIFGACVTSDKIGYVCYSGKWLWGEETGCTKPYVYRTEDGASWSRLDITLPDAYLVPPAGAPLTPVFNDSHGVMILSGLYNGRLAWLETTDNGATWEFRSNG